MLIYRFSWFSSISGSQIQSLLQALVILLCLLPLRTRHCRPHPQLLHQWGRLRPPLAFLLLLRLYASTGMQGSASEVGLAPRLLAQALAVIAFGEDKSTGDARRAVSVVSAVIALKMTPRDQAATRCTRSRLPHACTRHRPRAHLLTISYQRALVLHLLLYQVHLFTGQFFCHRSKHLICTLLMSASIPSSLSSAEKLQSSDHACR